MVFFSATSTTLNMGYDPHLDGPGVITSSGGTPTPTSASGSGSGASRTSSSWTKQGVQVLPTAVSPRNGAAGKQRAFKASNRDSPDEGIQDDCSTDVWTSRRWRRRLKWRGEVRTVLWRKKTSLADKLCRFKLEQQWNVSLLKRANLSQPPRNPGLVLPHLDGCKEQKDRETERQQVKLKKSNTSKSLIVEKILNLNVTCGESVSWNFWICFCFLIARLWMIHWKQKVFRNNWKFSPNKLQRPAQTHLKKVLNC